MSQVVGLPYNSYKPITNTAWVRTRLCKLQKGCIRLAAASDKDYQLLGHCRQFSPGTPVSSTTKTGHHDIAEILLKVALKHQKSNKINRFALRVKTLLNLTRQKMGKQTASLKLCATIPGHVLSKHYCLYCATVFVLLDI